MKKALSILFATFYLLLAVGATVNVHYCGGNLSSVKLYSSSHACCCVKAGIEEMTNCCDDETFFVQLDEEQDVPVTFSLNLNLIADLVLINNNFETVEFEKEANEFEKYDLPPPSERDRYIVYHSLIYYG